MFRSILYQNDHIPAEAVRASAMPAFFEDLHLDQVVAELIRGREAYDLAPFFYSPLRDVSQVLYRQQVMKDIEKPQVSACIRTFAENMITVGRRLAEAEGSGYRLERERLFLDAVEGYCKALQTFAAQLSQAGPESPGLLDFRNYLDDYIRAGSFTVLFNETESCQQDLSSIRYCVLTRDLRVEVHPYEAEEDYTEVVERVFKKFKQDPVKDYRAEFAPSSMNHVEAAILDGVASLYPEIFKRLSDFHTRHAGFRDETIMRFDREIQFYISYSEYIEKIRTAGLACCYPEVSDTDKAVYSRDGFDLALAGKLITEKAPVVCNDFYLSGKERIIIVSGPNQGGKTTFSRTFGQLHYFAALGLPVAGSKARLFLFDQLFSHFEKEEHIKNLRSKLEDDLVRIHDILKLATPGSIIILNEILSSTTLQDAVFLSRKIMQEIDRLDALCVWVTFIEELLALSDKTVSMVSTVVPDNPALRTFKIERRPADGLAYALSIAEKYRVTYQSLRKRIQV
jgi:hypothetical protein